MIFFINLKPYTFVPTYQKPADYDATWVAIGSVGIIVLIIIGLSNNKKK